MIRSVHPIGAESEAKQTPAYKCEGIWSQIMQGGRRYTDRRSWEVPPGVTRKKNAFGEGSESQKKRKLRENNLLKRKKNPHHRHVPPPFQSFASPPCMFLSRLKLWSAGEETWNSQSQAQTGQTQHLTCPAFFLLWVFHSSPPSITARQRIGTMSDCPSRTFSQLVNCQCLLATCNMSAKCLLRLDYNVVSAAVSSLPCGQTAWRLHRLIKGRHA